MIKFCFRVLAYVFLIFTTIIAVFDAANTVGTSKIIFVRCHDVMAWLFETDVIGFYLYLQNTLPPVFVNILSVISALPAIFVFGLISMLFYMIGYKRPKNNGRNMREEI